MACNLFPKEVKMLFHFTFTESIPVVRLNRLVSGRPFLLTITVMSHKYHSIANYKSTDCSTVCFGKLQRKHQNSALLALCECNAFVLHKGPEQQRVFPCHDIITITSLLPMYHFLLQHSYWLSELINWSGTSNWKMINCKMNLLVT